MINDKKIAAATDAAKEFCSNALKEVQKHFVADEDGNCDIKTMPRKEQYEFLLNKVSVLKAELHAAKTEVSVNTALDKLAALMAKLNDSQFADVKTWSVELTEVLNRVKLHALTLDLFDQFLQDALSQIESIIAVEEEKENDNSAKLKALFLELAEVCREIARYSDEIAKIVDIDKILTSFKPKQ